LFDGRVRVGGCEVIAHPMTPEEAFHRAFMFQEFDVTELSMSNYMTLAARGASPYVAIPAFVSRMFRHSSIYIRTDKGIDAPADLKGKTVGVPEYPMTAAMWIRGILQDEYGVAPADMRWRNGGQEQPGGTRRVQVQLPDDVELQPIPADETLNGMLDRGDLDALISARAPSGLETNDKVERLFPDYRMDEEAYFARTGMFPIMHLVGIRRSIVEQHPWLPVNVYLAYLEAKRICYRNLAEVGHLHTTLPWPVDEFAKARALMGEDFWPYGAADNAKEIEAMSRYSFEQGLTDRKLAPEELFAPSTLDLPKL
jgi:4,5-dihydroxyphthalate decarboxylase